MLHSTKTLRRLAHKRDGQGFTLIELMVVVLIIGILVAIAVPVFLGATSGANETGAKSDARNALTSMSTRFSANNALPAITEIDADLGLTSGTTQALVAAGVTADGRYYATSGTTGTFVARKGTTKCWKVTYANGTITKDNTCTNAAAVGQAW